MNKQENRRLASNLIEKYPYATLANDEGYAIHKITLEVGKPTQVLLTFENECFIRTLFQGHGDKYFYHNAERIMLSSFYEV